MTAVMGLAGAHAASIDSDDFEAWGDGYAAYGISTLQGIDNGTDLPNGWHGIYENTMSAQQLIYDKTIGNGPSSGLKNGSSKAITLVHELAGDANPVTITWDVKKNFDTATNQYLEIYTLSYDGTKNTLGEKIGEYDIVGQCNATDFTTVEWTGTLTDGLYGFRSYAIALDNFAVKRQAPFAGDDFEGWGTGYAAFGISTFQGIDNGTDLPNGWHGIYENKMSAQQLIYDKTIGRDGSSGIQSNSTAGLTLLHELTADGETTLRWDVKKKFDTATNQYLEIYTINYDCSAYTLGEKIGEYDIVGECNATDFTTVEWSGTLTPGLYGFRMFAIALDNFEVVTQAAPVTYNLSCVLNGQIIHSVDLEEGAPVVLPTFEEIVGYPFTSWEEEVPEVMPPYDVVLHGTYATGVDEVTVGECGIVDVYTMQGVCVGLGVDAATLAPGLYILRRADGSAVKVSIR